MASSQELIQIEQIDKGLNSLNTTINNTSASYLKLVKNIADNTVAIKEQAITFDGLAKAQKTTTDNAKQLDSLGKQLAATEAKLKDLEDSRTATIIKNKLANQEATKELTLKIKAQQAERGSTEQLIAVNAILEQRLKSVNQTTEEGRKKADLLRGAIDRNNVTIKDNSSALTAQKINIGNYGSALDGLKGKFTALGNSASNLPGPLGMASKGLIAVGKEMWALVANPIGALIAGIVIVFTSLYSIFTSTASGGKLVKEVMASISAIFDVLKQRATVLIDAFGALFSGDFSRAADLFSQSVSGIGKQMEDAAKEAWSLVDAQSALNKELAFHVSEESKEVNAIQKALFAAKDKTKSDRERLDNLNLVMKLSKEQSEKEVEYAKRQYIIDTDKAALKAKVSGVTGDQLRAFIELDAVEQMQSLKTSESLKKMYDLIGGSDNFKPLEESYAKVNDADTKFFESNKRTASQQSTILNEMAADKADAAKKILEDQEKQAKKAMEIDIEVAKSKSDSINEILKNAEDAIKVQEQLEKELMTLGEDDLKAYMDNEDKKTEKAKEEADKKLEIAKELKDKQLEIAAEAINGIFDLGSMKRDEELSALDKEREKKLSNENLTAKQKEKINEEFDKKAAAIKTKQVVCLFLHG